MEKNRSVLGQALISGTVSGLAVRDVIDVAVKFHKRH